jgi:hypothetical protein
MSDYQSGGATDINFPADPHRYPLATPEDVDAIGVPNWSPSGTDDTNVVEADYASDTELRDAKHLGDLPLSEFDARLHKFFTAYAKEIVQYGYAVPVSGAGGHVTSGPGIIYGLNFANPDTATPVYGQLIRESDNVTMIHFTVPVASDATHPGTVYVNVGTNGSWFDAPGLSVVLSAQAAGVAIIARKIAL